MKNLLPSQIASGENHPPPMYSQRKSQAFYGLAFIFSCFSEYFKEHLGLRSFCGFTTGLSTWWAWFIVCFVFAFWQSVRNKAIDQSIDFGNQFFVWFCWLFIFFSRFQPAGNQV